MRERGLKFQQCRFVACQRWVAPHAGAWIEILGCWWIRPWHPVAPHAGAWIEIRLLEPRRQRPGRSPCGSVD